MLLQRPVVFDINLPGYERETLVLDTTFNGWYIIDALLIIPGIIDIVSHSVYAVDTEARVVDLKPIGTTVAN